jgi:presenilin-like A22 family membrane protease
MKHNLSVTVVIITLFLISHLIGLFLVDISNPKITVIDETTNEQIIIRETSETPGVGKMEPLEHPYVPILIGIILGTGIMLLLIKFRKFFIMRSWHVIGIAACLYVSFFNLLNFFFKKILSADLIIILSLVIGVILAFSRLKWHNIYIHNFSETFIYAGIAVLFAPIFKTIGMESASVLSVSILLIGISIYDAIAVWQSKHMITLANAQTEQRIFAGIFIPYENKEENTEKIIYGRHMASKEISNTKKSDKQIQNKQKSKKNDENIQKVTVTKKQKSAILGGGDIAFTLLFSSVILLSFGFFEALIVSVVTTIALSLLLFLAKKDKFYPAMPFLSAGCFIGLGIIYIL